MSNLQRTTTGFLDYMNPDVIADMARLQLRGRLGMAKYTDSAFQGKMMGNSYIAPTITGGSASELTDGGTVTDTTQTVGGITFPITTFEYSLTHSWGFDASQGMVYLQQFVKNGLGALLTAIEGRMLRNIARDENVTNDANVASQSTMKYEHVKLAWETIMAGGFSGLDEAYLLGTVSAYSSLRAESEFNTFDFNGLPGMFSAAEYNGRMLGFVPQFSSNIYNGASAITFAVDDASGFNDSVTTFGYDTNSVADSHPNAGDVLLIDSEKILVLAVTITDADQGVIDDCVRAYAGTTAASHLDDAPITVVTNYQNLAFRKSAIQHIFVPHETFSHGAAQKFEVVDADSGIRFYMLDEYVSGYGGKRRITMMSSFGCTVFEPAGVCRIGTTS